MVTKVETARNMVYKSAWLLDQGKPVLNMVYGSGNDREGIEKSGWRGGKLLLQPLRHSAGNPQRCETQDPGAGEQFKKPVGSEIAGLPGSSLLRVQQPLPLHQDHEELHNDQATDDG